MPENNNRKKYNFRFAMSGLLIVCGGLLFYYILFHFDRLSSVVGSLFSILTPLLAGILIAYILNPLMVFLEKKVCYPLWRRIKKKKDHVYSKEAVIIRVISVFITLVIFIAALYALIMSVVPQTITNIKSLYDRISVFFFNWQDYYASFLSKYPQVDSFMQQYMGTIYTWVNEKIKPALDMVIKTPTSIIGFIVSVFKSLFNFVVGLIISVYLLYDKEKYIAQSKKVLYAFFNRETANNFINNIRYSDNIFGGFIVGKIIDSIIIGILCYICMLILGLPYPALISVLVGATNVIPYFGPFIGAIPSALIILMVPETGPKNCLIFLIFILILQQFDGNILGPKILGSSIGLNGFWVVLSITVFSKLLGVLGIFLGVPVFAVIYAAVRTLVNERLAVKHMPVDTGYYIESDYIPEDDNDVNNAGKSFRFARKTFDKVARETYQEEEDRKVKIEAKNEKKENKEVNEVSDTGSKKSKG